MDKLNVKRAIALVLLFVMAIVMRLSYKYPWHPDHYTIGSFANVILDHGYATWVLHPLSLFGYYPLSRASGYEFMMSVMVNLTGLELGQLILIFSILSAIIGGFIFFVMMREWTSHDTSFFTTMIYMSVVFFVKVTSNTASTRITNIILYPLFILFLFKLHKNITQKTPHLWRNVVVLILLFIQMSLIHRLSQMSIIFVIAFIAALLVEKHKEIWSWYETKWLYKIRAGHYNYNSLYLAVDATFVFTVLFSVKFMKLLYLSAIFVTLAIIYYFWMDWRKIKRSRKPERIFSDVLVFGFLLAGFKFADLLLRGRLGANAITLFAKYKIILAGIIVLGIITLLFIWYMKKHKKHALEAVYERSMLFYKLLVENSHHTISVGLLLILFLFLLKTLSGGSFYNAGFESYTSSFLLKGESFWIIFFNFLLNLNNNLSPLIWFAPIAFIYLAFKKNKKYYDYFWLITAIGFSQFIMDAEYIRLYMIPLYSIFIGLGMLMLFKLFSRKHPRWLAFFLIFFLSVAFLFANIFTQREYYLGVFGIDEEFIDLPEEYYMRAGDFLPKDNQYSIHTSSSTQMDRSVAYYAGIPTAVDAQNVHIRDGLEIRERNLSDLWSSIRRGDKVRDFYYLNDWLFAGTYFHGRHIRSLNGRTIYDPTGLMIIKSYAIKYIIDSDNFAEKNGIFTSVVGIRNKIYSSGKIDIYDLHRGRVIS